MNEVITREKLIKCNQHSGRIGNNSGRSYQHVTDTFDVNDVILKGQGMANTHMSKEIIRWASTTLAKDFIYGITNELKPTGFDIIAFLNIAVSVIKILRYLLISGNYINKCSVDKQFADIYGEYKQLGASVKSMWKKTLNLMLLFVSHST